MSASPSRQRQRQRACPPVPPARLPAPSRCLAAPPQSLPRARAHALPSPLVSLRRASHAYAAPASLDPLGLARSRSAALIQVSFQAILREVQGLSRAAVVSASPRSSSTPSSCSRRQRVWWAAACSTSNVQTNDVYFLRTDYSTI